MRDIGVGELEHAHGGRQQYIVLDDAPVVVRPSVEVLDERLHHGGEPVKLLLLLLLDKRSGADLELEHVGGQLVEVDDHLIAVYACLFPDIEQPAPRLLVDGEPMLAMHGVDVHAQGLHGPVLHERLDALLVLVDVDRLLHVLLLDAGRGFRIADAGILGDGAIGDVEVPDHGGGDGLARGGPVGQDRVVDLDRLDLHLVRIVAEVPNLARFEAVARRVRLPTGDHDRRLHGKQQVLVCARLEEIVELLVGEQELDLAHADREVSVGLEDEEVPGDALARIVVGNAAELGVERREERDELLCTAPVLGNQHDALQRGRSLHLVGHRLALEILGGEHVLIDDAADDVLAVGMVDDVAVIVQQRQHIVLAHVMAMVDDRGTADVHAIGVDEDVRPLLEAELDAGVVVVVALETRPHRGEGVDERHLERLREVRHHVDAVDLRRHDLVVEDVLQEDVLLARMVVLRSELAIRHALDGVGEHLPEDVLRAALGEVLGLTAPGGPFVDGFVLREEAVQLVVLRPLHHLGACGVVAGMHLRDVLGGQLFLVDVPALLVIHGCPLAVAVRFATSARRVTGTQVCPIR